MFKRKDRLLEIVFFRPYLDDASGSAVAIFGIRPMRAASRRSL